MELWILQSQKRWQEYCDSPDGQQPGRSVSILYPSAEANQWSARGPSFCPRRIGHHLLRCQYFTALEYALECQNVSGLAYPISTKIDHERSCLTIRQEIFHLSVDALITVTSCELVYKCAGGCTGRHHCQVGEGYHCPLWSIIIDIQDCELNSY